MTDYLGRIKSEEKQLKPDNLNLGEMLSHLELKLAEEKIEQYQKELKEIYFKLTGDKPN